MAKKFELEALALAHWVSKGAMSFFIIMHTVGRLHSRNLLAYTLSGAVGIVKVQVNHVAAILALGGSPLKVRGIG
ncbi:hypothetical protein BDN72DRAFT_368409 [Pluteus cervinus]|uniref:Uncharacterized protein n=1 Tax=Pluteus cervinus TaxID=181527 RepID=A0ACD3BE51_9AGAR|nr:hypothetical protein BDN72DRAFT_368409 [Pluteus cervinus]